MTIHRTVAIQAYGFGAQASQMNAQTKKIPASAKYLVAVVRTSHLEAAAAGRSSRSMNGTYPGITPRRPPAARTAEPLGALSGM